MLARIIAAFAFLLIATAVHAGPADTLLGEWTDAARSNRVVPYKIYLPNAQTPSPIVIFSHGLGGSRDGAVYLLSYLAEHGYVAVAVQHAGSDTPAVFSGGAMNQAGLREATSAGAAADRFRDIPFAIDELTKMNASDARLKGRLDMSRIGMSGHSYGAITTMALSGQGFGPLGAFSFDDARIKAAIAYSPSKPRQGDPASVLSGIRIPMFHMTGTNDQNPLDPSEPASNRQIPYRHLQNADKYLLVFQDGDHMIFSGRDFRGSPRPNDPRFHAWIQKASLAFWDAYLRGNADAKTYLTGGKFKTELGAEGTFEFQLR
jgi:predicted dienelactone hydrolase